MANKEANTLGQELEQQLFSGINAAQKAPLPLKHKPWRFSTGPTTAAGKARMAANGKKRQIGPRSVREIRADLADLRDLMDQMRASAQMASKSS